MNTGSKKKQKKSPKAKKTAINSWNVADMVKKWKAASTVPYLTNRLKSLQRTRTKLVRAGEIDKAVVIQQGIQKLQLRIEKLKRRKRV